MIRSTVEGLFQAFRKHEVFVKLDLPAYLVLLKTQENLQKCFSGIKWRSVNLNSSGFLGAIFLA